MVMHQANNRYSTLSCNKDVNLVVVMDCTRGLDAPFVRRAEIRMTVHGIGPHQANPEGIGLCQTSAAASVVASPTGWGYAAKLDWGLDLPEHE